MLTHIWVLFQRLAQEVISASLVVLWSVKSMSPYRLLIFDFFPYAAMLVWTPPLISYSKYFLFSCTEIDDFNMRNYV